MGGTKTARLARLPLVVCAIAAAVTDAHAQIRRIAAETTPIVESDGVRAGTTVRAALVIRLPEGFHVQSNQPRDPSLIPPVLTVNPPAGVQLSEIAFPPSTDLRQLGSDLPLAVFEREVAIGVTLVLAEGLEPGGLLPFFLGIGMAVPWPLAGAGLASLPRPGAWMVRVKQAFGVLILGTAVYYGYLAYDLFSSRWVKTSDVTSSVSEKLKAGWYASLADGLETAQREQKPVLIDLWAT